MFSKLLGDNKPRDKISGSIWVGKVQRKDATHIRSDQTALIKVQHGDNLGRSWCACVCSFRDTNGRQCCKRKKFVGVCL